MQVPGSLRPLLCHQDLVLFCLGLRDKGALQGQIAGQALGCQERVNTQGGRRLRDTATAELTRKLRDPGFLGLDLDSESG